MKKQLLLIVIVLQYFATFAQYSSPESVVFDATNNRYLISNAGSGNIMQRPCTGNPTTFISGLTSPKGMVIVGTRLFVTDVTSVRGFNLSNGASVMNLAISGSIFLNDIESNGSNYLYVSDMNTHKIFRIDITSISSPTYTTFVSSGITSPNGLLYDASNSRLLLVSYRSNSPVEAIDLSSAAVSTVITTSLSNLDGITRDDSGYIYFSSWSSNSVYRCNSSFTSGPTLFESGHDGPADIYFNNASKVLVIPNMNVNTISYVSLLNPVITASGPLTKCPGVGVSLQANTGSCLTYQWKRNGSNIGSNNAVLSASQTGTYTVTITNIGGSKVSNSVVVNDFSVTKPVINPSGIVNICLGDSVKLTSSTGRHYLWSYNADTNSSIYVYTGNNYTVTVTDSNNCKSTSNATIVYVGPSVGKPTFSALLPDSFCQGDSTVLSCNQTGFNYHWSNGDSTRNIVVKTTGNYSLLISDTNNCFSYRSDSMHIEVLPLPAAPQINVTGNKEFCLGDSVILNIISPQYPYHWSDGDTHSVRTIKTSGSFYVFATDQNNCSSENSDTIKTIVHALPSKPTINIAEGTTEFCDGDSVILYTTALPSHKYEWSTGLMHIALIVKASGNFNVRLIDKYNCISPWSDTVKVTVYSVPPKPVVGVTGNTEFCEGDSVILTAPSGYLHYYWTNSSISNSIIIKSSGVFKLQLADNPLCKSEYSDSIVTVMYPKPAKPVIQYQTDHDYIIAFTPNAVMYKWYQSDSKQGPKFLLPEGPSVYEIYASKYCHHCFFSVVIMDSNGCVSDTSDEFDFIHVGIDNPDNSEHYTVYPIPANNMIWIELPEQIPYDISFQVFDMSGKSMMQGTVNRNNNSIDLSGLEKGSYLLSLDSGRIVKLFLKD